MEQGTELTGIAALESTMKTGRIPHAMVLESKQEELLSKYALRLSQWAVCRESEKPCLKCTQCKKAVTGNHPDIYTAKLFGKSQAVNVDEIRKICSDAYIKPNEANIKVYIIPNADKMQQQAQNAFLKVLEEPPQSILFILCCTSATQLLRTIRSRVTIYSICEEESGDEQCIKAYEKAQEIALAITKNTGYSLLKALGTVTDRAFARLVVDKLSQIAAAAIKGRAANTSCPAAAEPLRDNVDAKNLIQIIDILAIADSRLNSNINMNLFGAWLCAELRRLK